MPFFSFSVNQINPSLKKFNITPNKVYYSKNTQLWKLLNKEDTQKLNTLSLEKRIPITKISKKILFCLPPSIGLGDAIEYASGIKKTIEKIKRIHEVVKGNDQFGNSYYANDPYLLNWVHMTESICFFNANQLFTDNKFNFNQKNQYFSEMSIIAKKFGINEIVTTEKDINTLLNTYQKDLIFTDRSQVVMDLIMNFPCHFTIKPIYKAFSQAAIINLPDWAFTFLPIKKPSFVKRKIITNSVKTIALPVRNALKEGIAFQAKKRMNIF